MKIVVIGDGKVGFTLTEALSKEGHDIVVIDNRQDVLDIAGEQLDVLTLYGNGASLKVQRQADVGLSDLMIAVTSADEINLLCCMVARKLGCKNTIARIREPEYLEQLYLLREELGLSMNVNPESSAAREIFRLLQYPSFLKRDSFAKGRAEIVELPVQSGGCLDGLKLLNLQSAVKARVLVCAVERQNDVVIPDGHFELAAGDKVYVTAPTQDLIQLMKSVDPRAGRIRDVLLIGGSRIALYLGEMLLKAGIRVKLIEKKRARCDELCDLLPGATVIWGDGTSLRTLTGEGIAETDAVVTLTNIDEENLLISMFANHMRVPKVITKINRTEYSEIFRDKGVECVVSPKLLTCAAILRYVRAMQNTKGSGVITMHRIVDGRVDALEFEVTKNTSYKGVRLADVPVRKGILIACIARQTNVVIPSGSDTFNEGDTVIVVAAAEGNLNDLNDIFDAPQRGLREGGA